jgi:argininosuccinate synthase
MSPAEVLAELNAVGGANGVGRLDIVENRYVGIKSRGAYETPGGTIMLRAHRAIESLTLDREVAHLKDELMPRYASLIYNGYWWSPERRCSRRRSTGHSQVRQRRGAGQALQGQRRGRRPQSTDSLFDEAIATFEEDEGAYDQADAEGFIKLNALRLRTQAKRRRGRWAREREHLWHGRFEGGPAEALQA